MRADLSIWVTLARECVRRARQRLNGTREAIRVQLVGHQRDLGELRRTVTRYRAEILLAVAVLSGWASLTYGVRVIAWGRIAFAVWPISTGLLLLSACGWGFLGNTAVVGLYVASRKRGER
jgi:hypothetical protein